MYTGFLHYKGQSCAEYAENYFFEFHIQYLKYLGNGCPLCPGGSARTAGGARQVAPAGRLCAPRSRSPLQFIQPPPSVHPSIFKTSHSRLLSRLKTLLVGKLLQSPTYHAPPLPLTIFYQQSEVNGVFQSIQLFPYSSLLFCSFTFITIFQPIYRCFPRGSHCQQLAVESVKDRKKFQ